MIKPGDDEETSPTDGHKFYHNSIEHMVNEQKALKGGIRPHEEFDADNSEDMDTPLPAAVSDIISLQRLTFEMWVSQPDDWEHALHHYTRLQSFKLDPIPLADVRGWQVAFPHLPPIVDTWSSGDQCELILLDASFKLMEDFPPRHSKLGIGLELDFLDPHWPTVSRLDDFKDWACVTHMYRDGHEISDPAREECRASGPGKFKPSFQSRRWASTFTSLTEAKKLAEDSKDLGAIELANEHSSNVLRSLTIMQELSAVDTMPGHYGEKHSRMARKKKAVLLWRFSEAPLGSGGTTTWQSVWVHPSNGLSISSTLSSAEMGLPPLSIHGVDDCSPCIGSFDSGSHFLSHNSLPYHMYLGTMNEELCQDGFMSFKPEQVADSGHLLSSFPLPSTQPFLSSCDFGSLDGNLDITHSEMHAVGGDNSVEAANIFELPKLKKHIAAGSDESYMKDSLPGTRQRSIDPHEQPLTRFNIETHQVLQEQLGPEDHDLPQPVPAIKPESQSSQAGKIGEHLWVELDRGSHAVDFFASPEGAKMRAQSWVPADEQDEALRSALLAACAMSDLGAQTQGTPQGTPLGHRRHGPYKLDSHHESRWAPPSMLRPILHSHHSFPGLRTMQDTNGDVCGPPFDDHDGAHGLALLQSQLRQNRDKQLTALTGPDYLHTTPDAHGSGTRGVPRAQSEPDPGPIRLSAPNDAAESSLTELDHRYFGTEGLEGMSRCPLEIQSQLPTAQDTEMGDSAVEVPMDDVQQ